MSEEETAAQAPAEVQIIHSYPDPKWQKCYERFLSGETQKDLAIALKIPERTLAWRCSRDHWNAERKARTAIDPAKEVAALAKVIEEENGADVATDSDAPDEEAQARGQQRILQRQQRMTGMLVGAFEQELTETINTARLAGKKVLPAKLNQLRAMGDGLFAMERKAWQIPDKIETKDTTPTRGDRLRGLKDEDLERHESDVDRQLAEAEGRATPHQRGEAPEEGVN